MPHTGPGKIPHPPHADPPASAALLGAPELDVALLAFLLHFVWEFWQVPWYQGMNDLPHLAGVLMCSRAAAGNAVIALTAYAGPALMARSRFWARDASLRLLAAYLGIGLTITVGLEWLATEVLDRWQYVDVMPTLPLLGTGLAPLLQWIVLPLLLLWLLRRAWRPLG